MSCYRRKIKSRPSQCLKLRTPYLAKLAHPTPWLIVLIGRSLCKIKQVVRSELEKLNWRQQPGQIQQRQGRIQNGFTKAEEKLIRNQFENENCEVRISTQETTSTQRSSDSSEGRPWKTISWADYCWIARRWAAAIPAEIWVLSLARTRIVTKRQLSNLNGM